MEKWKRNLWISCCAGFIVSIGMSQMAPMLPLYIADMGIHSTGDIEKWSGIIFGCNFISLAIFSPIWGRLSGMAASRWHYAPAYGWGLL